MFALKLISIVLFAHQTFAQECGGKLTGTAGQFTTPNYPDDYPTGTTCKWIIEAPVDSMVSLTFKDFDIEAFDEKDCAYDYVRIQDGEEEQSPSLGSLLCGETVPEVVESSGRFMTVIFNSHESSLGTPGFLATYKTVPKTKEVCRQNLCGGVLKEKSCNIQSPGFPISFQADLNCTWTIQSPSNTGNIELKFSSLELGGSTCDNNKVVLYDGDTINAPTIFEDSLCGLDQNRLSGRTLSSTKSSILVVMTTTSTSERLSKAEKGFSLNYNVVGESSTTTPAPTTVSKATTTSTTTTTTTVKPTTKTIPTTTTTTTTETTKPKKETTTSNPAISTSSENQFIANPAAVSGVVIGSIIGVVVIVFGIFLIIAFVHWRKQNKRFNIRLRDEDARSDVNTLLSSADSIEFQKHGRIVRRTPSDEMFRL